MDANDAWASEVTPLRAKPDQDPLALDEDTAERLLAGDLSSAQAPPGYGEVAALLAAAVAAPSPAELAGQEAAVAELQAVIRTRQAPRGAGKPGRRRVGLVVAVAIGALSAGGVAAAATGNLPDPLREAARSILMTGGEATPGPSTKPGRQPVPTAGIPDAAGATSEGQGATAAGGPATAMRGAVEERLCRASKAHKETDKRKQLDPVAINALAHAAGGADRIATYCKESQPGSSEADGQGKHAQAGDHGQGQGGEPLPSAVSTRGHGAGKPPPSNSRAGSPETGKPLETGPRTR